MGPRYARIRSYLRERIENGTFKPGDRLPSEKELATRFQTTRATVAHALQQLVFEGMIVREAGRGTFVAPQGLKVIQERSRIRSFEQQVEEQGGHITFKLVAFSRVAASPDVAARLGVTEKEEVYNLLRIRLVEDLPTVVENRFLPLAIAERMTINALSTRSMYRILEEEVGCPVKRIDGEIRAMTARAETARLLHVGDGAPVLVRDYVLTGVDGRILACGNAIFREQVRIAYSSEAEDMDVADDMGDT